jgi:hypothetical protein
VDGPPVAVEEEARLNTAAPDKVVVEARAMC